DVTTFGLTGRQAESALVECGLTLNRNSLPFDPNGAWWTSGIRIGTPATTSLGMGKTEMAEIASIIHLVLSNTKPAMTEKAVPAKGKYILDEATKTEAKKRVNTLLDAFVLYPELDLDFLKKSFVK
ncbi:MAG TPA: glycine hydroxymethyltransferase, partial [Treponemataceae bacterium]|nr:glycine hydroxymethyltransferase [Treponemataceae bacterium]